MATIKGTVSQRSDSYTFYIEWSESKPNIANNTREVTAKVYVECSAHTAYASNLNQSLTIEGEEFTATKDVSLSPGVKVELVSGSKTITHNSDGSKTISLFAECDLPDGSGWGPAWGSASGKATLTKIPRASSITATDANIESATTINIKRASSSFTHTITYSFEGLTGTVASKTSDTSVGWTIPSSFYKQIPNAKKGTVTLTCTTYSESTKVGTSTCKFEVTASKSKCRPTVTATLIDSNDVTSKLSSGTTGSSKLIKYKSTAKITPTATAKNSATIKSITVNGTKVSGNYIAFKNVQSETFKIVVTDSRGYTNTEYILKPTIVKYIPLTLTYKFYRPSATGSEIKLKYSGNYFDASFGSITNTLTVTWKYKEHKSSTWIEGETLTPTISNNKYSQDVSLGTLYDYQKGYDFMITVKDELVTLSSSYYLKKGEPIYDYGVDDEGNNYFNVNGTIYCKNKKIESPIRKLLFSDSENTDSEITLSDSVYNYSYIYIESTVATYNAMIPIFSASQSAFRGIGGWSGAANVGSSHVQGGISNEGKTLSIEYFKSIVHSTSSNHSASSDRLVCKVFGIR